MKKNLLVLLVCSMLTLRLTACNADMVNAVIGAVWEAADVDTSDIKVEQSDVDTIEEHIDKTIDTGRKIMGDEDVQEAVKDTIGAVMNAASSSEESE